MALLQTKFPNDQVGLLRSVLSGSVRLQKRLCDAAIVDSPICMFCGYCDETLRHCFWECPRWVPIRASFQLPDLETRSAWPACTIDCGIFVEDEKVLALNEQLEAEEAAAQNIASWFKCSERRDLVVAWQDVHVQRTVWTDGASPHNQDDRFRRAGSGIY